MRDFVLADFEPLVGDIFNVPLDTGRFYPLTLLLATALPAGLWAGEKRAPFQLQFKGPADTGYLPQGIHTLLHESSGEYPIGLVVIGRESDGFRYQAVFN